MKDEVRLPAACFQDLPGRIQIILIQRIDMNVGAGSVFAVPDGLEVFRQVPAHEALGPGNENVHRPSFRQTILFTTPV